VTFVYVMFKLFTFRKPDDSHIGCFKVLDCAYRISNSISYFAVPTTDQVTSSGNSSNLCPHIPGFNLSQGDGYPH